MVRVALDNKLFAETIKNWYRKHQRDLPWRRDVTLYQTVVSEFMLQQTQVAVVIPYFERWMRRFPDFASLASASEDSVLKCWEGLGYYSRAKNLQALAQSMQQASEGDFKQVNFWLHFPGIGDYTARAIVSIALKVPEAVVDGNVVRVFARLTREQQVFKSGTMGIHYFRSLAEQCLCHSDPDVYNQAVMELGATVCKKWNPVCAQCPVKTFCMACVHGDAVLYPKVQAKNPTQVVEYTRIFCLKDHHLLLQKIPQNAQRLKGLFELPKWDQDLLGLPKTALLFSGARTIAAQKIQESIYAGTVCCLSCLSDCIWIPLERLNETPLSGPHARWIRMLLESYVTV